MPEPSASRRAWSQTHGVVLSAALIETDDRGETWRVEAKAANGTLGLDVTTDGSHTPDPFECLFGVWEYEAPEAGELAAVVNVLGAEAVADLALLVGF